MLDKDLVISTPKGYNWIVQDELGNTYDACWIRAERRGFRCLGGSEYYYCGGNFTARLFRGNNSVYVTAQP